MKYNEELISGLNMDIVSHFPHLFQIDKNMKITHEGVSRLVMLERYTQKDIQLITLKKGDLVTVVAKHDPKFPAVGIGYVIDFNKNENWVLVQLEDEYRGNVENDYERETGIIKRNLTDINKPLELYWEQIAKRVANNLASQEGSKESKNLWGSKFYDELSELNLVPAGRVLYGAGSNNQVSFFNCFVMPFVQDSREGIADHRKEMMEIMSRGGKL